MTGDGDASNARYPFRVRFLHWLMAAIILGMILVGFLMVRVLPDELPAKFELLYPYHKSFGILVLILVAVRLIVRRGAKLPGLPLALAPWERQLAKVAHVLLYALMIVVPLLGYGLSSSFSKSDGIYFFGVYLPELLSKNDARFTVLDWLHTVGAYTLLGLIVLHAAGAIKHRFIDRDTRAEVLTRML